VRHVGEEFDLYFEVSDSSSPSLPARAAPVRFLVLALDVDVALASCWLSARADRCLLQLLCWLKLAASVCDCLRKASVCIVA